MSKILPGDVLTTTYFNVHTPEVQLGFKAHAGEHLVFVFLGNQPRDGNNPLDVDTRMNELGWFRDEEKYNELIDQRVSESLASGKQANKD